MLVSGVPSQLDCQSHLTASMRQYDIVRNAWLEIFAEVLVTNYNKNLLLVFHLYRVGNVFVIIFWLPSRPQIIEFIKQSI
jgi:hypothetical protein